VLPDRRQPDLLARVRLGREVPLEHGEWAMLAAVPHRHTHRGAFSPEPLPAGLLPGLQHDAIAEGATLILLDQAGQARMRRLATVAARWQQRNASVRAELARWTREEGSPERDGVPAHAYPASLPAWGEPAEPPAGKLAERDFDLGRGAGRLEPGGAPPAASAVLITVADGPADWLRAGQALNRMLIHAAGSWVFAALNTQPMESAPVRALVRDRLRLPGAPQMLLEFGRAHTAPATARRPAEDLLS